MNKTLAVAVLLLGAFAISFATSDSKRVPVGTFAGPRVIAKVALTGQTAAIPTTTILKVPETGVYRVSGYMTQPVTTGSGYWGMGFNWNDNSGPENTNLLIMYNGSIPPNDYAFPEGVSVPFTFSAVAGTPISYYVIDGSASGTYEVYLVIERLI